MKVITHDGQGNIVSEVGEDDPVRAQTRSSKTDYAATHLKGKTRQIETLAETDDDVHLWLFNYKLVDEIDTDNLPDWFNDGLDALEVGSVISSSEKDAAVNKQTDKG